MRINDFITKIKEAFSKYNKKTRIIIIIGLTGILLIFISELLPLRSNGDKLQSVDSNAKLSVEEYELNIEKRLSSIITCIRGVDNVNVMVTLDNNVENVYEFDEKKSLDTQENDTKLKETTEKDVIVLKDNAGENTGLIKTQIQPTIKGVVVVCSGGDITSIKTKVIEAVTTVLDITPNKVCVVGANSENKE